MRDFFKKAGAVWQDLLFDDQAKFALWRILWALAMTVLLIADPFCAAGWFRCFLYFLLAGALVLILGNIKNRKGLVSGVILAAVFFFFIWLGRGDAVSGYGMAALLVISGIGLLKPSPRQGYPHFNIFLRLACAAAALAMAGVMVINGRKLGIRYLDHLIFYALGCAGCAFAWLSQIRKSKI